MKTPMCLSLDDDVVKDLRTKAIEYDVSIADLATMAFKFALGRITPEAARAFAAARPSTRGPLSGGLTLAERAVLSGVEKLKREQAPAFRFSAEELAGAAGMRLRDAYPAMQRLEARGTLHYAAGFEPEADKWGRRPKSIWCLVTDLKAWEVKGAAERLEREAQAVRDAAAAERQKKRDAMTPAEREAERAAAEAEFDDIEV